LLTYRSYINYSKHCSNLSSKLGFVAVGIMEPEKGGETTMLKEWETLKLEINENGVAVLTLNRPKNLNSFNVQLCNDYSEACQVVRDNDARVMILTGAGPGFCSGGDVSVLAAMDSPAKSKWTYDQSTAVITATYEMEIPVIAAVNGPVAGAGTALMMACDLIIAADTARLAFNFIGVAFCPDSGASYFLTRLVGYQKAAEILMFGRVLKSQEAERLGIVNKVVPADQLMDEALSWATKLAAGPGYTIKMDKKLLRAAMSNDFYQQAELESLYQILAWSSDDFKEGTRAFLEKRKPEFKGK
jgi:2-(1,2-epoxy-1,2-dihydrophenyl)acetyl-CoA isomerase